VPSVGEYCINPQLGHFRSAQADKESSNQGNLIKLMIN